MPSAKQKILLSVGIETDCPAQAKEAHQVPISQE